MILYIQKASILALTGSSRLSDELNLRPAPSAHLSAWFNNVSGRYLQIFIIKSTFYALNVVSVFPSGRKNGIKYEYFSVYRIKVINSSIVTTLERLQ